MIFGIKDEFAIEIGDIDEPSFGVGIYVQFQFWIGGRPIGDWDDIIAIEPSIDHAAEICANEQYRRERLFTDSAPSYIFDIVYDGFFNFDYSSDRIVTPNMRDRYHLDCIGLEAIYDKYGVVVVGSSVDTERVIAKDLRNDTFIVDVKLCFGVVESALKAYVDWGRKQVRAGKA